jgi:hypothetical protein
MFFRSNLVLLLLAIASYSRSMAADSVTELKIQADKGDPAAQLELANRLIGSSERELWLRRAAGQGYAPAQGQLGWMLLMRSRTSTKAQDQERLGEESVHWSTLAALQGDTRGQADLSDLYLEGKWVKQDFLEAYKWGELASRGSSLNAASVLGGWKRDAAVLKMSPDQIAEAKKRVEQFRPRAADKQDIPRPVWLNQLRLSGLSGTPHKRFAMINGTTLAKGETGAVRLDNRKVQVQCREIHENSVVLEVEGYTVELR